MVQCDYKHTSIHTEMDKNDWLMIDKTAALRLASMSAYKIEPFLSYAKNK